MKMYRNAIILLVVFGLLAGGYLLLDRKVEKKSDSGSEDTKTEKILEIDREKISQITVKNPDGTFVFKKKDKDWVLSSPAGLNFSKSKMSSIESNISSLYSSKVIEENAADLAQYGLNSPVIIEVKLTDGSVKTLELGSETPTKDAVYAKLKDSGKVYTITSYTADTLKAAKKDMREKALFSIKPEEVIKFSLDRKGQNVFTASKKDEASWEITAPIEAAGDAGKIMPIIQDVAAVSVMEFEEENPADLSKFGLDKPSYVISFETSSVKNKILMGAEKVKGSEIYAMLADGKEVFTLSVDSFKYLDKPLKEIMDSFVYIVNINDVSKMVVEMDGRTTTSIIETNKDDKDKDKFVVEGKDVKEADKEKGDSLFRKYYQSVIGIIVDEIDTAGKPSGNPEVTITYSLKKAPGTMKVELVPKDGKYYYALRNGKYTNILVEKKKLDEKDGIRDSYKKLAEAIGIK
ncbi:MAG: DUF4340 domain-containing protein [Clostridia bacterium]|nr:DUF4340 domain-containing protein [Clostridia bacterium]